MAGPAKGGGKPGDKKPAQKKEAYRPPKELPGERKKAIEAARTAMEGKVAEAEGRLRDVGANMPEEVKRQLNQYFESSVDRADTDHDNRISADEIAAFKDQMLKRTDDILKNYAPTDAQKAELEKLRAAGEKVSKTPVSELPDLDTIPESAEGVNYANLDGEMNKLSKFNEKFQLEAENATKEVKTLIDQVNEFNEKKQGFTASLNGVYQYLKPWGTNELEDEITEWNNKIREKKREIAQKKENLGKQKGKIEKYGEQLGEIGNKEKERLVRERAARKQEFEAKKGEMEQTKQQREQQYQAIEAQQNALRQKKLKLTDEVSQMQENEDELQYRKQKCDNKKRATVAAEAAADQEIAAFEHVLRTVPLNDEAKKAVEGAIEQVRKRKDKAATTTALLDEAGQSATRLSRKFTEKEQKLLGDVNRTSDMLENQVVPGLQSMSATIMFLEDVKINYATTTEQVDAHYDKKIDLAFTMEVSQS